MSKLYLATNEDVGDKSLVEALTDKGFDDTPMSKIIDDIGLAIQNKEGTTDYIPANEMAERIANLPSGKPDWIYDEKIQLDKTLFLGQAGQLARNGSVDCQTYMIQVPFVKSTHIPYGMIVKTNADHNRLRYGIFKENPLEQPLSGDWSVSCLYGGYYDDGVPNQSRIISLEVYSSNYPQEADYLYVVLTVSNEGSNKSEPIFMAIGEV